MPAKAKNIVLVMLVWCSCAHASERCASAALYQQVMTAAETGMGPFVLFRGEVTAIRREPMPRIDRLCCVSCQCYIPAHLPPPPMHLDYAVHEALWGSTARPAIPETRQLPSSCGLFHPALHEKIITLCAVFAGWPDNGPMYCQRPIADTAENLRRVRAWIPQAIAHQQREKVSEEEARTHLIYKVNAVYPNDDLSLGKARVHGDVVLQIFISRQGTIQAERAISGPSGLGQSAINAVAQWRYKPFRANGRPIQVDTTATVHF
jgi:hypothetical protein